MQRAYGKPLCYFIHNSWYVGLHIMNSNSCYDDFFFLLDAMHSAVLTQYSVCLSVCLWRTSGRPTSTVLT